MPLPVACSSKERNIEYVSYAIVGFIQSQRVVAELGNLPDVIDFELTPRVRPSNNYPSDRLNLS